MSAHLRIGESGSISHIVPTNGGSSEFVQTNNSKLLEVEASRTIGFNVMVVDRQQ